MTARHLGLVAAGLLLIATPAHCAAARAPDPLAAICADDAGWVEAGASGAAGRFAADFAALDRRATSFSARFTRAFATEGRRPDAGEQAALARSVTELRRALARLLPASEPDNTGGPLMFSLDQLTRRNAATDRDEVLRAAFVREMAAVSLPRPRPDISRFPALLEMTAGVLDRRPGEAISDYDLDTLRTLADGLLAESYDTDFRRPAIRVLDERWHTSLASRLRRQVRAMCEEAGG